MTIQSNVPLPEDEAMELPIECSLSKIRITKQAKRQLEELLTSRITRTISAYCDTVGISPNNFYATLAGNRTCTIELLNKLLSGIGYQVSTETRLILHPTEHGEPVPGVDSVEQELELPSNDEEDKDVYGYF